LFKHLKDVKDIKYNIIKMSDKQTKMSFVGRVCSDFLMMPWDKIVAGLITGLLIYIGAARLFIIQDNLYDTNLKVEQIKLEFSKQNSITHSQLNSRIDSLLLDINSIELRINRNIKTELKSFDRMIEDLKDKINDQDKRITVIETKLIIGPTHIQNTRFEHTIEQFTKMFNITEYVKNKNSQCTDVDLVQE